jgi:hypothetical protein
MHLELDESKKNKAFKDSAHESRVECWVFFRCRRGRRAGVRAGPSTAYGITGCGCSTFSLDCMRFLLVFRARAFSPAPCWSSASVQGFLTSIAID